MGLAGQARVLAGALKSLALFLVRYREIGVVISILILGVVFTYLNPRFASPQSFFSIVSIAAELGLVASGISLLIIAGEFDLSVGSVFAASGMLAIWLVNSGAPFPLAIASSMALATLVGLFNALVTIKGGIPSFIATLGTMWLIRGLLLAASGGFPVRLLEEEPLLALFAGYIVGELRTSALWYVFVALALQFLLLWTAFGNKVQAVGGAPETARALGVNVARVKTVCFVVSSNTAALAGIVSMARHRVVEPIAGMGIELEAIASAVLGGTSLAGGVGSVLGAMLAAFLIGEIRVGLVLAGAPAYWYIGFVGALLIFVGIINLRMARRA